MASNPDKKLHHVSIEVPQIVLYDDLKKKIAEIRVKRDAVMMAHSVVNISQDRYNKFIIILSLMSAFFESTKAQLDLAARKDWVAPCAILAPILLSTILGIVSSLMKFKKFPERMEMLTKATEKCNATVLQMRRLIESLNFQPYKTSYDEYSTMVMVSYRDALENHERALYPHEHAIYLTKAIALSKNIQQRENDQENAIDALLMEEKGKQQNIVVTHPQGVQLGTPIQRLDSIYPRKDKAGVELDETEDEMEHKTVEMDEFDDVDTAKEPVKKETIKTSDDIIEESKEGSDADVVETTVDSLINKVVSDTKTD